jgi:hypothetical protein
MYHNLPTPPPPQGEPNPLQVPVEWYVDIPTSSLNSVFEKIASIQESALCSVSCVSGGDNRSHWARLVVFGKPLGIHNCVTELRKICPVVEVGYSHEAPFPFGEIPPKDELEDVMPVYHAAWTDYNTKRK